MSVQAVVVALVVVVVVVVINKRAEAKRVYETSVESHHGYQMSPTQSTVRCQYGFSSIPVYVLTRRIQLQVSLGDVGFSVRDHAPDASGTATAMTEGHTERSTKSKKKRYKTKPMSSKERKKIDAKKGKSGGSVSSSRSDSDGTWRPNPDNLDDSAWENALRKFFQKHNSDKLSDVPKMAKIYSRKRGCFLH